MKHLDYPKVDFHVHAFPDQLAQRALQTLVETYGVPAITDGTISGLIRHMKGSGVDYSVVQPVATKPSQVRNINEWAAQVADPAIVCFGAIHPDCDSITDEIEHIISLGLPGIKIQSNWQGTYPDDPKMYPIYEAAQGKLIVMFHAGNELAFIEDVKATPQRLANVHRDFPRLTMIAAHMGGYKMWDEAERHLVGKSIYFDTSACFCDDLSNEQLLALIRRHGAERVLFATDSPFGDAKRDIARLLTLGLTDEELELIFWKNAKFLLNEHLNH